MGQYGEDKNVILMAYDKESLSPHIPFCADISGRQQG